jgi:hypothetical protein
MNPTHVLGIWELTKAVIHSGEGMQEISPCIADLNNLVVLQSSPVCSPPPLTTLSSYVPRSQMQMPTSPRQFGRTSTVPASSSPLAALTLSERQGSFSRTASSPHALAEREKLRPQQPMHEFHIFLASNQISHLPEELFLLTSLTILTLRKSILSNVHRRYLELQF